MSSYFPMALDLHGRDCLVVGGGAVATRKLKALLIAGAEVRVVAPEASERIRALAADGSLRLIEAPFSPDHLDGAFLVVAATDQRQVNDAIIADARRRHILVNSVDGSSGDFIMPATIRRGEVQVAITTGGQSPALARHLRTRIEAALPDEYGPLSEVLSLVRSELLRENTLVEPDLWQRAISPSVLDAVRQGDHQLARDLVRARLLAESPADDAGAPTSGTASAPSARTRATARCGHIVLVGAGPGDPGLLTVAGRDALARADTIVYDRLANPTLLDVCKPQARLVYAGKQRGGSALSQAHINSLICSEARAGNYVVRLKGGDPFVFGRGGEEALAATQAGIPFTVIPGISAAIAAPAYAGIPVTQRGMAASFTVLTGHEDPTKSAGSLDWEALAHLGGTLILLMGVETLGPITARLIAAGLDPETPAAVIEGATTAAQRTVSGTLATIAEFARAASIKTPATTVIGAVARLSEELSWWTTESSPENEHSAQRPIPRQS